MKKNLVFVSLLLFFCLMFGAFASGWLGGSLGDSLENSMKGWLGSEQKNAPKSSLDTHSQASQNDVIIINAKEISLQNLSSHPEEGDFQDWENASLPPSILDTLEKTPSQQKSPKKTQHPASYPNTSKLSAPTPHPESANTPTPPKNLPKKPAPKNAQKPKLAIIMDDMAYPWQLKSLHQLGLKITPSFFPYNDDNKLTPKMAANEAFYMVHLPLEALHFYQSPHRWIKTGQTPEEIEDYIAQIKHDFPKLAFINNHTGSKFSASYPDMKNFIDILEKYGITFVDSRTTADTKAPEIYAQMQKPLLSREVFLDNHANTKKILHQIKIAIALAKKKGYAIAICHPHKETFHALAIAKKSLFDGVELVTIDTIFDEVKKSYAK
ncbi:divergent polysaccharide deacetylase family protein [Helicobacter sp. 11S02596-1]|uniref:divergent polysaccharide deacetylase family protein n=1 Tax=Helicobacter sp. 11S02596-1 TaxID=1476194 RepID=UPI000BA4F362|nr:divergent polysaccharide deacetylase family protein [Helicobacter sp. 11S02596-1]PAF44700.1 hypothetical protein BJI48_01530 [Helicobacter sp. 11S02596-1]